jgi:hypothetical protein
MHRRAVNRSRYCQDRKNVSKIKAIAWKYPNKRITEHYGDLLPKK